MSNYSVDINMGYQALSKTRLIRSNIRYHPSLSCRADSWSTAIVLRILLLPQCSSMSNIALSACCIRQPWVGSTSSSRSAHVGQSAPRGRDCPDTHLMARVWFKIHGQSSFLASPASSARLPGTVSHPEPSDSFLKPPPVVQLEAGENIPLTTFPPHLRLTLESARASASTLSPSSSVGAYQPRRIRPSFLFNTSQRHSTPTLQSSLTRLYWS